ncbi:hypothetical protein KXV85_004625, partial [Aspergillus fumigatus]
CHHPLAGKERKKAWNRGSLDFGAACCGCHAPIAGQAWRQALNVNVYISGSAWQPAQRSGDNPMPAAALDAVHHALSRIAERDRDIRAWTALAPAAARRQAVASDPHAPLYGLVLGVKDVIDVAGLPTGHNSPLAPVHAAPEDAPCVALLRKAGAI